MKYNIRKVGSVWGQGSVWGLQNVCGVRSCNITKEIEEYIGVHYIVVSRAIKRAEGEEKI